jgi:hypothetical protein
METEYSHSYGVAILRSKLRALTRAMACPQSETGFRHPRQWPDTQENLRAPDHHESDVCQFAYLELKLHRG